MTHELGKENELGRRFDNRDTSVFHWGRPDEILVCVAYGVVDTLEDELKVFDELDVTRYDEEHGR